MPATRLGKQIAERKRDRVYELLMGRKAALNLTDEQFGELVGWSKTTTYRRLKKQKNTKEWQFGDVVALAAKLGIPAEDFREAIRF